MSQRPVVHECRYKRTGPFLLSREDIAELDAVLKDVSAKLASYLESKKSKVLSEIRAEAFAEVQQKKIKDKFDEMSDEQRERYLTYYEEMESHHRGYEREKVGNARLSSSIIIKVGNKRYPNFKSLGEASKSLDLTGNVNNILCELSAGEFDEPKVKIELGADGWTVLDIEGRPDEHPIVEEVYSDLKVWAEKKDPGVILRSWSNFGPGFSIVFALLSFLTSFVSQKVVEAPTKLGEEAALLLKNHVSDQNLHSAVEVLLRISTGEELTVVTKHVDPRYSALSWFFILMMVIAWIRPSSSILDIKGESNRLKMWRVWIKIVIVSVPGAICIYILERLLNNIT